MLAFFVYLGLWPDDVADELAKLGVERAPALDTVLAAVREDQ
jgi:hypothetical protein